MNKEIEIITRLRDADISGELATLETALKEKEKHKAKVAIIYPNIERPLYFFESTYRLFDIGTFFKRILSTSTVIYL